MRIKKLLILGALVAQTFNVSATFHDAAGWAQYAGSEVVNLAKWTQTEVDAAQTEINTLKSYENTLLQLT
jgi:hypothetical protein